MSSYYTAARLAAMRKERLKQELADAVQKVKEQLQVEHSNDVGLFSGQNIEISVVADDNSKSGYNESFEITGSMLCKEVKNDEKRDELDFSGLLFSGRKKPSKLESELDSWVRKTEERPIITKSDESDRTRLVAELSKIISSPTMDIEDKIKCVKMRVMSYLQGAVKLTADDIANIESLYYQYCALCQMLGITPTEKIPYRISEEIERMTAVLEKKKQDEYIMDVIEDIMEDLGCHAKDGAVLEHVTGQVFSVEGHPLCDVFIGNDGNGIMFEPIGESKEGSLEQSRQIESSANSICGLYEKLEEKAAERGVILKRVYIEPVHIDSMCVQSDISERKAGKRKRKTANNKAKAIGTEG